MKGSKKKKDMRREPGRDYQKLLKYTLQGKKRKLKKLLSRGQVAALYLHALVLDLPSSHLTSFLDQRWTSTRSIPPSSPSFIRHAGQAR